MLGENLVTIYKCSKKKRQYICMRVKQALLFSFSIVLRKKRTELTHTSLFSIGN